MNGNNVSHEARVGQVVIIIEKLVFIVTLIV